MITYDPKRWLDILLQVPRSPVFATLALDVIVAGAYAALVVWYERDVANVAVPLGPAVLSLLGIILGLLLVFRTNTAYERWWEGRRLWGQLVNVSRSLSQSLDALLPADAAGRRAAYAATIAEFPVVLAAHLRAPASRTAARPHDKVPDRLAHRLLRDLGDDVRSDLLPREALVALVPLATAFNDVTGGCERIRKTPIPYSYSSYIKQFVLLYALVLPFALVREFGYGAVIAEMLVFFSTMGLELLANEIEEPFGTDRNDLPIDDIAVMIGNDARATLVAGATEAPGGGPQRPAPGEPRIDAVAR